MAATVETVTISPAGKVYAIGDATIQELKAAGFTFGIRYLTDDTERGVAAGSVFGGWPEPRK